MGFTDKTKANIRRILADNRNYFISSTISLVDNSQNGHYRVGLNNIYFGDSHSLKNIIEKTIVDETNLSYKNNIVYKIDGLKEIEYEEVENYYKKEFPKIEDKCKSEFWAVPENQQRFDMLSNFRVFKDIIVDKSEYQKYGKCLVIFDVENWQRFHKSLIALFFPDFKHDTKLSSKVHRYTKSIGNNLFLGIEYDFRIEQQSLSRGNLDEFSKYKIVLLNSDFDRKTKREEYFYSANATILPLADAVHPIFKNPCTELFRFFAREDVVETHDGVFFQYQTKYEYLPNDKIRMYNSEQFGLSLKSHAFFYMDIFVYYLKQYLQFLESCLISIEFGQK